MKLLNNNQIAQKVFEAIDLLIPEIEVLDRAPMDEWILVNNGQITEQSLMQIYENISNLPVQDEDELENMEQFEEINLDYLEEKVLVPLEWDDDSVNIAIGSPYSLGLISQQWFSLYDRQVTFTLLRRSVIERKLTEVYQNANDEFNFDDSNEESLKDLAKEAPIVRLVNDIFARANEMGASDIHVEPSEIDLVIRYRVDGVLITAFTPPLNQFSAIASRLKLIGGLNIAERRVPQDGRIELNIGKVQLDIRMSTLPGMHGESIVMRLLQKNAASFTLENVGMDDKLSAEYKQLIKRPHGLLLVVGPTGSGKTTTLYCVLGLLNSGSEKIITVEDPVEYQVNGITQVQVKASIGLTFASGLRSIVRQDPDIILVGEIRDKETAEICINSALTGHLVLSTLHTNDAAGAISRLQDMGVESFLIASALVAVLSQRLVRRICPICHGESNKATTASETSSTCKNCGSTGYKGRMGIYELLKVSEGVRQAIIENKDNAEISRIAVSEGMRLIQEDAQNKADAGLTTQAEVLRVCAHEH